ncbi:hypothetical protein Anapl_16968 [Anas platyrhynchos]|uniref:Uncharacterized protein n=1 Tax=Anas platyrhynchos TaxID=8839 RepID=R0K0D9_ANAPL|nr:hypothetical protein Anapl_16968 [Anas platyrhynchos]
MLAIGNEHKTPPLTQGDQASGKARPTMAVMIGMTMVPRCTIIYDQQADIKCYRAVSVRIENAAQNIQGLLHFVQQSPTLLKALQTHTSHPSTKYANKCKCGSGHDLAVSCHYPDLQWAGELSLEEQYISHTITVFLGSYIQPWEQPPGPQPPGEEQSHLHPGTESSPAHYFTDSSAAFAAEVTVKASNPGDARLTTAPSGRKAAFQDSFLQRTRAVVYWTSHQCNENQQQYSFISFEKYGLQVNLVLRFDAEINSGNRLWPVIHEKTDTILRVIGTEISASPARGFSEGSQTLQGVGHEIECDFVASRVEKTRSSSLSLLVACRVVCNGDPDDQSERKGTFSTHLTANDAMRLCIRLFYLKDCKVSVQFLHPCYVQDILTTSSLGVPAGGAALVLGTGALHPAEVRRIWAPPHLHRDEAPRLPACSQMAGVGCICGCCEARFVSICKALSTTAMQTQAYKLQRNMQMCTLLSGESGFTDDQHTWLQDF